jgi:aminopeptidase N
LASIKDTYTTRPSGREVHLEIFSEPENVNKLQYAMTSLIKSMKWDEDKFGLEYDLGIYNIVAVNDFNMGAMGELV